MASNDNSDLDSRIAAIVESTVGRMRDDLAQRLQDTESRLRDISDRLGGAPEAPMPAPVDSSAPGGDAGSDLFDAIVAIDRGGSQQDVLAALLEGVGRFAGRSALFLTRADAAQGWGSYGFEESAGDLQQVVLSYSEGPLATLAEGHGCVPLSAEECGDLCRRMGASPASEALLVPFVLRDRVAAALYVDRFADDPPLARRSVQLLTYAGAQAVEGLALRQRDETPTLQIAAAAAAEPGVALWEAPAAEPAPTEPETAVEESPVAAPEAAFEEPPPAEPEVIVEEPPLAEPEVTAEEPIAAEPEVTAEEPALAEPETPADLDVAETTAAEPAEEAAPGEMVTREMPVLESDLEPVADTEWELDSSAVEPEPIAAPPAEELTEPLESLTEPTVEAPPPWSATAGAELPAVETEAPTEVSPPADSPSDAGTGTTEVRPPTDVSGPGWAFTASRAAAESGDDAQHEEARRLARLLVTEIKLYNEEQVEEGRRGNDIYARLREDIDRSRQIFNERVDDAVRQETDYFRDEMVRILAGGNAEALGD